MPAMMFDSVRSAFMTAAETARGFLGATKPIALHDSTQAISAYLASGMLRKVINIPAHDRVREWRDWQAEEPQIKALEAEERRLGIQAKVKAAEVLRGLGGGALLLITAGDHSTPLNPDTIRKGGLIAVNVVSRWQLQLDDIVTDLASPDYGLPRSFTVNDGANRTTLHPSRVVCFRGEALPTGTGISAEDAFWGASRLLGVLDQVTRSDDAQVAFAALMRKAKLLRIGIPELTDFTATAQGQKALETRVQTLALGEGIFNATVYQSGAPEKAESITDYQVAWTGIPEVMDAFDQRVAAVADIPFTRLMGRSPAGMNATGQHDTANWHKAVAAGQNLETRPCMDQIDPVLIRSAGVSPTDVWWSWSPLDVPSQKEETDRFKVWTEAAKEVQATGAIPDVAFVKAYQNGLSENGWMPGLDGALAELPEDERFGLNTEPDDDPSALQAKGGDPSSAGGGGDESVPARRAANDAKPRTLYVSRKVLNVADLAAWAREQGLPALQDDLHVTIAYSTTPVDWIAMGATWADHSGKGTGDLIITAGGPRVVEPLGDRTAVLMFASSDLSWRNREMREAGASWDWPDYQPHISLTGEPIDLSKVEPYRGVIRLGPEIFEEVDTDR